MPVSARHDTIQRPFKLNFLGPATFSFRTNECRKSISLKDRPPTKNLERRFLERRRRPRRLWEPQATPLQGQSGQSGLFSGS